VLFEATGEPRWFVEARRLGDELLEHFATPSAAASSPPPTTATGSSRGARSSRTRRSPRGGSSAALGLLRLAALTGEDRYAAAAEGQLRLVGPIAARHPGAFAHLLQALALHLGTIREVAVVGPEAERAALVDVVRERPRPDVVLAAGPGAAADPDPAGAAAGPAATSWTDAPRRTSASASRAGGRSRRPRSCERCWPDRQRSGPSRRRRAGHAKATDPA
jgi:uncharacterized protein YyaL (SSP411 family)